MEIRSKIENNDKKVYQKGLFETTQYSGVVKELKELEILHKMRVKIEEIQESILNNCGMEGELTPL